MEIYSLIRANIKNLVTTDKDPFIWNNVFLVKQFFLWFFAERCGRADTSIFYSLVCFFW